MSSDLQYITDTLIQCSGALKVVQTNNTGLPELMGRLDVSIAKAKGMNDADAALREAADQFMAQYPVPKHETTEGLPLQSDDAAPDPGETAQLPEHEDKVLASAPPPPVSQTDFAKADQTPPSVTNAARQQSNAYTVDGEGNLVVT